MDEFKFEVETTTSQEMPIIVKDGRGAGVLRNTGAIGDAYAQRLDDLRKLGYICVGKDPSADRGLIPSGKMRSWGSQKGWEGPLGR